MEQYMNRKRVSIVHLEMVKEGSLLYNNDEGGRRITTAREFVKLAAPLFKLSDREKFYVVCIDSKGEPITIELAFVGGLSQCQVCIPEIFKSAILSNCNRIICCHNHPSGSVKPSKEDKKITSRIREAGRILGIELVDHIILGDHGMFYSFAENYEL